MACRHRERQHAALRETRDDRRAAVRIEPARAPELAPLLVAAYGFTPRERSIVELVARGNSTKEIAAALRVTTYTVQDHVKSIFDKSGTSSRGALVSRLFLDLEPPAGIPSIRDGS